MIPYDFRALETLEIYGISDMHSGAKGFKEDLFRDLTKHILETDNRYVVLGGDIAENALKNSKSDAYASIMQPKAQQDYAVELLQPLKDRILIMIDGNHELRSLKDCDMSPTERIADKLGISDRYSPDGVGFLKIDMDKPTRYKKARRPRYSVGIHHGLGGVAPGTSLARMIPLSLFWGVDLMISGHTHQPLTAPAMRYEADLGKNAMLPREFRVMTTTAWLDYCGYAVVKGFRGAPVRVNYAILNGRKHDIGVMT
jgi:predicted phosphodiesterase